MISVDNLKYKFSKYCYGTLFSDRRCQFYDLSKIHPQNRKAKSRVIQFYSSVDNIGNYLPVLGIRKMIGETTDTWCIHDKQIDFDFINKNYQCAIIGGAGLLHECFEPFWNNFLQECKLPTIIWGVGSCIPDGTTIGDDYRKVVAKVAKQCDLVNVRDQLTADYFGMENVHLSPCPTLIYLEEFQKSVSQDSNVILFSSHEELFETIEKKQIRNTVKQVATEFKYTDNIQYSFLGLDDIIRKYYAQSRLVVTTRLHGAIIAYGLGIPYILLPRDEKLRAFYQAYKNGISVNNTKEIEETIKNGTINKLSLEKIKVNQICEFGEQVRSWLSSHCYETNDLKL